MPAASPVPHPEPASCKTTRARAALTEALERLALIGGEISAAPGTRPERRPEWWLGHLQGLAGYLLLTLEEADHAASYHMHPAQLSSDRVPV